MLFTCSSLIGTIIPFHMPIQLQKNKRKMAVLRWSTITRDYEGSLLKKAAFKILVSDNDCNSFTNRRTSLNCRVPVHVSLVDCGFGTFLMGDTWGRGESECRHKHAVVDACLNY